jgi:hypothetical protein
MVGEGKGFSLSPSYSNPFSSSSAFFLPLLLHKQPVLTGSMKQDSLDASSPLLLECCHGFSSPFQKKELWRRF